MPESTSHRACTCVARSWSVLRSATSCISSTRPRTDSTGRRVGARPERRIAGDGESQLALGCTPRSAVPLRPQVRSACLSRHSGPAVHSPSYSHLAQTAHLSRAPERPGSMTAQQPADAPHVGTVLPSGAIGVVDGAVRRPATLTSASLRLLHTMRGSWAKALRCPSQGDGATRPRLPL